MSINDFKKKWEPDDVLKWLTKYLGEKGQRLTETQRKTLEDEEIGGDAFVDLTDEELQEMGFTKKGPLKALKKCIKLLNERFNTAPVEATDNCAKKQPVADDCEGSEGCGDSEDCGDDNTPNKEGNQDEEPADDDPQPPNLQPPDLQPADPKPEDPQPADPQPEDPQPPDLQPADPQPPDPKPEDPQPPDPKPEDPPDPQPVNPQPSDPLQYYDPFCVLPDDVKVDIRKSITAVQGEGKAGITPGNKVWKGKKQLKVKFMQDVPVDWNVDGEDLSKEKILTIANNEWHGRKACLPEFVEEKEVAKSDIRVKFYVVVKEGGVFKRRYGGSSWSLIGTDALLRKEEYKETMFLDLCSPDNDYKKHLIVHEFGHALGLGHEHQRSDFWDKAAEYIDKDKMMADLKINEEDFKNQWGEEAIDIDDDKTDYDPKSVMHYWFRPSWLKDEYAHYRTKAAVEKDKHLTDEKRKVLLRIHNRSLAVVPSVMDVGLLERAYGIGRKGRGPPRKKVEADQVEGGEEEDDDGQIRDVPQGEEEADQPGDEEADPQPNVEIPRNPDPRQKKGIVQQPDVRPPIAGPSVNTFPIPWHILPTHCLTIAKDHFKVTQALNELEEKDVVSLGTALGLSHSKLKKMKDLPADMVAAWLRQEDEVLNEGEPTLCKLIEALEKLRYRGAIKKVLQEFKLNVGAAAAAAGYPGGACGPPQPQSLGGDPTLTTENIDKELNEVIDWQKLGTRLDVKHHHIRKIENDVKGTDNQRKDMIATWLKNDPNRSWEKLCKALKQADQAVLAEKLRKKYIK